MREARVGMRGKGGGMQGREVEARTIRKEAVGSQRKQEKQRKSSGGMPKPDKAGEGGVSKGEDGKPGLAEEEGGSKGKEGKEWKPGQTGKKWGIQHKKRREGN